MAQLITGENWKFRRYIAAYGAIPGAEDLAYYGDEHFSADCAIPALDNFGYDIGYLTVVASTPEDLARNDWDCGDEMLCAGCAETSNPGEGNEWGFLPLRTINGDIGRGIAVSRCDRCGEIIEDAYTTLTLEVVQDEDRTVEEREDRASDLETAITGAPESANALRSSWSNPGEDWAFIVLDMERERDAQHISGGSEPPVIAFAGASSPFFLASVIRERFADNWIFADSLTTRA